MEPLSDLSVFKEIVDAGSFVKAAERLGMTPSGISKRLSRYESRLACRLLNRTTRSLSPTEAGESLYARALTILADLEQAEFAAKNTVSTPQGRLRVACSDAFALHVLVPMLAAFRDLYPGLTITILQGDGPIDLVAERIDVAIRFERPTYADFVVRQLTEDPWVVCASPEYLTRYGTPASPSDLSNHHCLTILAREQEDRKWRFSARGASQVVEIESVFSGIGVVVKEAALEGLGIARLARFLVQESLDRGELVRVLESYEPPSERSIFVVYPHREFLPIKVRAFVDFLTTQTTLAQAKGR